MRAPGNKSSSLWNVQPAISSKSADILMKFSQTSLASSNPKNICKSYSMKNIIDKYNTMYVQHLYIIHFLHF